MGNWVADKPAKYVKSGKGKKPLEIDRGKQSQALPPSQGTPVTNFDKGNVRTPEMATPHSVTEDTTRHLSDVHNS